MAYSGFKARRKFSLREIYEAMLYGVPKAKGTFWKRVHNAKKGIDVIEEACAIGRIAMNLGETDYGPIYSALGYIRIIPDPKYKSSDQSLAEYIISKNDNSNMSIEDIAEKIKPLINLDQVVEVR